MPKLEFLSKFRSTLTKPRRKRSEGEGKGKHSRASDPANLALQVGGRTVTVSDVYNVAIVQKRWRAKVARRRAEKEAAAISPAVSGEQTVLPVQVSSYALDDVTYACGHAESSAVLNFAPFRNMLFKKRHVLS